MSKTAKQHLIWILQDWRIIARPLFVYVLSLLVFFPSDLNKYQFLQINTGLHIEFSGISPAYAALQDSQGLIDSPVEFPKAEIEIHLQAGPEPKEIQKTKQHQQKTVTEIQLAGTRITQDEELASFAQELNQEVRSTGYRLAAASDVGVSDAPKADLWEDEASSKKVSATKSERKIIISTNGQTKHIPLSRLNSTSPKPFAVGPAPSRKEEDLKIQKAVHTIGGLFEISGGLHYDGQSTRLVVYRKHRNNYLEVGQVDIMNGSYTIQARSLQGQVVGELVNADGFVVGKGESSIKQKKPGSTSIVIKPVESQVAGQVVSAFSFAGNTKGVAGVEVFVDGLGSMESDAKGRFRSEEILDGSTYIVHARHENYWGSLAIGNSSRPAIVPLYEQRMVQTLLDIAGINMEEARNYAIVWGRVTDENGRPVEGAEVEISGEALSKPIYFNAMFNALFFPDQSLKTTGKNGLFAFVNVNPGIHMVRAKWGGQMSPAQIFPAEPGFVSTANIALAREREIKVRVVDAFKPGVQLKSEIAVVNSDKLLELPAGEAEFNYYNTQGLQMLEVEAADLNYERSRMDVSQVGEEIRIPLISRYKLLSLAATYKINRELGSGIVLGYVDSGPLDVGVAGHSIRKSHIVYFDRKGKIVRSLDENGGGFMLYNVPPGMQTLLLAHEEEPSAVTRIVVGDPNFVSVVDHRFIRD